MSPEASGAQSAAVTALAETILDYVQSDDFQRHQEATTELVELMAMLCQVPIEDQHDALVWWARSQYWDSVLMLLTGWQGKVARAAYLALKKELDADTPGKRWYATDWRTGRASIERLLGLADNPFRVYAGAAFRTWIEHDGSDAGRSWIAGAIGSPPILSEELLAWRHLDIRDVILWDPRTNEVRVAEEAPGEPAFVLPDRSAIDKRLTVWGDGGAYFRAWAKQRARKAEYRRASMGAHPFSEAAGTDLPGALFVGDIRRARWPQDCGAAVVDAGLGMTAAELHIAAVRAANLPVFQGA